MGRRNRKKRTSSEEDESLERRYLKRQKVAETKDGAKTPSEDVGSAREGNDQEGKTTIDKVEQLRLKKQRRKELKRAKEERKMRQGEEEKKLIIEAAAAAGKRRKDKKSKDEVEEAASKQSTFRTLKKAVQCQDVVVGQGPPVRRGSKVRVSYTLRAKNRYGKVLDSSKNFSFRLGGGEVIEGWDIGVEGMRLGGRRYLIVPPKAGYGRQNIGAGPGAILFFDVTVIGL
ncbi:FK506-binding protein 4 [Seminavis robusta]|uniref:peptidylprolyl isomerase n=1 Tax=Seminavis robusta TaxID=568900 RepID=A0A9N8E6E5_9STRA|nr:FK506-binding protein 4 [Seminavis robusta]|eukprot:Sro545_g163940.1 FK506-binding protein 4 (229) ;mRNA; f:55308-55994